MHNHIDSFCIFISIIILLNLTQIHLNQQLVQQIYQQYLFLFQQFIIFQHILEVYLQLDFFQLLLIVMRTFKDDHNLQYIQMMLELQVLNQIIIFEVKILQCIKILLIRAASKNRIESYFLIFLSQQNSANILIASYPKNKSFRYIITKNIAQIDQVNCYYIFIYIAYRKIIQIQNN
ncbi:unnamed protein product [Paramecium pentaurelia]|uniref:Transmembrane protein n=1 Tax=Paramecium pentaurelia TaxID=43138 RepID=A0A8S1S9P2_9CILI|nr:unnamed protein product [Paramecium pentaurelia]